MAARLSKIRDEDDRASIFSSKFRTPRLPPLEELTLLKVWALCLQLIDFEAELSANFGSKILLFDLFSQKRAEKEGANLLASLRKELALHPAASGSEGGKPAPRIAPSRGKRGSESDTRKQDEFRRSFWESNKDDHPDECMTRFLIQQNWDVSRAFGRLVAAVRWRVRGKDVEDIMRTGEEGAHTTINESTDERQRQIAFEFLAQCKMGKTFVRGIDWEGRPIVISRMRLHHPRHQSAESMKRYMVWQIECVRLMLGPSIRDVLHLWDFSGANADNVQIGPIKFAISIFQKYFPGALGLIIIHNSPKYFEGSWKVVKGLFSPGGVDKVKFTRTTEDLEQYIPRQNIIKELGGDDPWEFEYEPYKPGENDQMKNTELKRPLIEERDIIWKRFEDLTRRMISLARAGADYTAIKKKRNEYTDHLRASYWKLDPFLRARSYYDRMGAIGFRRESAFLAERLTYGERVESLIGRLDELPGIESSSDSEKQLGDDDT